MNNSAFRAAPAVCTALPELAEPFITRPVVSLDRMVAFNDHLRTMGLPPCVVAGGRPQRCSEPLLIKLSDGTLQVAQYDFLEGYWISSVPGVASYPTKAIVSWHHLEMSLKGTKPAGGAR